MALSRLPRRPSEIVGIKDPLDALIMDIFFLSKQAEKVAAKKEPKKLSLRERLLQERKRKGIPTYTV